MERTKTLEVIEVKKKTELLQLKFEFISHYLLGVMVKSFLKIEYFPFKVQTPFMHIEVQCSLRCD